MQLRCISTSVCYNSVIITSHNHRQLCLHYSPLPHNNLTMSSENKFLRRRKNTCLSSSSTSSPPSPDPPNQSEKQREGSDLKTLARRFWKVAAPYWYSDDDKKQARLQLAAVFALTFATTGISVGFNFLGRDFYNALSNKDQEQFTKQLLYYLASFAGGIPFPPKGYWKMNIDASCKGDLGQASYEGIIPDQSRGWVKGFNGKLPGLYSSMEAI